MKKYFFAICFILIGFVSLTHVVFAKKTFNDAQANLNTITGLTGIQEGDLTGGILANGTAAAFAIIGLVFFMLMVYAGVRWMSARGNEESVTRARNILTGAIIGLIIVISAYAITNFVQTRLIEGQRDGEANFDADYAGGVPLGCCLDWTSASQDIISEGLGLDTPTVARRWTTYADCKQQGENDGNGDFHSGPEGEGNWMFFSSETGMTWPSCIEEADRRN